MSCLVYTRSLMIIPMVFTAVLTGPRFLAKLATWRRMACCQLLCLNCTENIQCGLTHRQLGWYIRYSKVHDMQLTLDNSRGLFELQTDSKDSLYSKDN